MTEPIISSSKEITQLNFSTFSVIEKVRQIENLLHLKTPKHTIKSRLGLDRYELSHLLRISRKLTEPVKGLLLKAKLSEGHARAISRLPALQQDKTARDTIQLRWSVRRTEQEVKAILEGTPVNYDNSYYENLGEKISAQIGHPVKVVPSKQHQSTGVIEIKYLGFDAFDGIMARLRVRLEDEF